MKALVWHGKNDIRCEPVPDPKIEQGRDVIIKVMACAICGSDLHIFDGVIPQMKSGDVLGHETMGEVVEVGSDNKALKVGDRVVVPFTISCGECFFCKRGFFSGCERRHSRNEASQVGIRVPEVERPCVVYLDPSSINSKRCAAAGWQQARLILRSHNSSCGWHKSTKRKR